MFSHFAGASRPWLGRAVAALLCSFVTQAALAQPARPATRPDIVIGQVVDLSGPNTDFGKDYFAGAKTYFDFVNETGGVGGRRIVLRAVDSGGNPAVAVEKTRELLERDRVDGLFGYIGDGEVAAVASSEAFTRSGAALIAPLYGGDDADTQRNVFPMRPSYATEARHLVGQFTAVGVQRICVVHANDRAGRSAADAVAAALSAAGLKLQQREEVDAAGSNVAAVVERVRSAAPQAVIVVADAIPVALFTKAYRGFDAGAIVAGLSLVNPTALVQIAGPRAAEGLVLTQVVPNPGSLKLPAARELLALLHKYRSEEATHVTLEGFLAAKQLVAVLRSLGGDVNRARLLGAMREPRRMDLGGFVVALGDGGTRSSQYVDTTIIRRDGSLLR